MPRGHLESPAVTDCYVSLKLLLGFNLLFLFRKLCIFGSLFNIAVSGVKYLMQLKCFKLMEIQPARPACVGFSHSESVVSGSGGAEDILTRGTYKMFSVGRKIGIESFLAQKRLVIGLLWYFQFGIGSCGLWRLSNWCCSYRTKKWGLVRSPCETRPDVYMHSCLQKLPVIPGSCTIQWPTKIVTLKHPWHPTTVELRISCL